MLTRRIYSYTGLLVVLASMVSWWAIDEYPVRNWLPVLALVALNFAVENFSFSLPVAGSVSLSFAVGFAALIHSGPMAGIACALAASTNLQEIRQGKPLILRMFNAAQLSLSIGLAGLAYHSLGGKILALYPMETSIAPALVASIAFYLANVLFVSFGAALMSRQRMADVLRAQGFLSYGVSLLVLAFLGLLVAYLLSLESWLGLPLLVLPFFAARRTFRVYVELAEAYTSTVRSLVTAIEAKDPYTRGHSERVAIYATRLAASLGLTRGAVDLLERAALLHDVGKIGIALNTLTSPTELSSDEVRIIREHPVLGSQLAGEVEFLSDIVPIIRHHHERVDGAGYPDGLVGHGIPELARILSVADSYDAMTSDRAYRLGISQAAAIGELSRVAGTQLDPELSAAFVAMLATDTFGLEAL